MQQQQPNYQQGPPPQQPGADNGKIVAILSYCTLIGFIIAIVLHSSNKTRLGGYHLRQALGMIIFGFALGITLMLLTIIIWPLVFITPFVWLGMLILLILGIVNAANEQEKPVPLIGKMFEKMLSSVFN